MTKFNDTLDNTLGITDIVEKQLEVVSPKPKPVVKTNDNELENDYKYQRENFYQLVALLYVTIALIPYLPSGSFFSTYASSLFWVNYAIMISYNKKTKS